LRALRFYGAQHGLPKVNIDFATLLAELQRYILTEEAAKDSSCDGLVAPTTVNGNPTVLPDVTAAVSDIQHANSKLIGYGGVTLQDAQEPALSDDIDYVSSAFVSLLHGNFRKLPSQLDALTRITRFFSYLVKITLWFQPVRVTDHSAKNVWPRIIAGAGLLGLAGFAGWSLAQAKPAFGTASLANLLCFLAGGLALIASGCFLGKRQLKVLLGVILLAIVALLVLSVMQFAK
jgi:hypothetical protein